MTKNIFFAFTAIFLFAFKCERIPTFPIGESFEMKIGERLGNQDIEVMLKMVEMVEDSRCPKNTNCVWEGQAMVKVKIKTESGEYESLLNLRKGRPEEAFSTIEGYTYQIIAVEPYPVAGSKIKKEEYVVTLEVVEGEVVDTGNDEQ